jgi:hypothetical protein
VKVLFRVKLVDMSIEIVTIQVVEASSAARKGSGLPASALFSARSRE